MAEGGSQFENSNNATYPLRVSQEVDQQKSEVESWMQRFSTRPLLNSRGKNSFIVRGSDDWDFPAPISGFGHAQGAQRSFTRPKYT